MTKDSFPTVDLFPFHKGLIRFFNEVEINFPELKKPGVDIDSITTHNVGHAISVAHYYMSEMNEIAPPGHTYEVRGTIAGLFLNQSIKLS